MKIKKIIKKFESQKEWRNSKFYKKMIDKKNFVLLRELGLSKKDIMKLLKVD